MEFSVDEILGEPDEEIELAQEFAAESPFVRFKIKPLGDLIAAATKRVSSDHDAKTAWTLTDILDESDPLVENPACTPPLFTVDLCCLELGLANVSSALVPLLTSPLF